MRARFLGRITAVTVAAATLAFTAPIPALAADGSLLGRVTAADGSAPEAGVVVALVDPASRREYRSEPTDARGTFRVDAAPAGSYKLLVETEKGAYLASEDFPLAEGKNRPVSLALTPASQQAQGGGSGGSKLAPWAKWVIVGGIAVGGLLLIDAVTKDESEASPL